MRLALAMLEAEGLISSAIEDGMLRYRTTPAGMATLERRGRVPGRATVLFTDIVGSTELIAAVRRGRRARAPTAPLRRC